MLFDFGKPVIECGLHLLWIKDTVVGDLRLLDDETPLIGNLLFVDDLAQFEELCVEEASSFFDSGVVVKLLLLELALNGVHQAMFKLFERVVDLVGEVIQFFWFVPSIEGRD